MKSSDTLVFDIAKFSLHDGPGIRTTVFLKGCPLHCRWCHNPESQSFAPEILYMAAKCLGCGECVACCPHECHKFSGGTHWFDRSNCVACGKCAEICPASALTICGRRMSVDAVMAEVMKDKIFFDNSGGGLTVSGGEPLANFDFTLALLIAAKDSGINTCLETSGYADWEKVDRLRPWTDLWLWDFKSSRSAHRNLTGVDNGVILSNLRKLSSGPATVVLRLPLIANVNDEPAFFDEAVALAAEFKNIIRLELEPYNPLGEIKYIQLGRNERFSATTFPAEEIEEIKSKLSSKTQIPVKLG